MGELYRDKGFLVTYSQESRRVGPASTSEGFPTLATESPAVLGGRRGINETQFAETGAVKVILVSSPPGSDDGLIELIRICQTSTVSWFFTGFISQEMSIPSF